MASGTSVCVSNNSNGSTSETSETRSDLYVKDKYSESDEANPVLENNSPSLVEATVNKAFSENNNATLSKKFGEGKEEQYVLRPFSNVENLPDQENFAIISHAKGLSGESPQECTTSAAPNENFTSWDIHQDNSASCKCSGSIETSATIDTFDISDVQLLPDTLGVLPLDEQQKMSNIQQRFVTSKTDMQDLIARSNQELDGRLYLTTKVCSLFSYMSFPFLY